MIYKSLIKTLPLLSVSLFFAFLSSFISASAQQPWNHTELYTLCTDDIYFIAPSAPLRQQISDQRLVMNENSQWESSHTPPVYNALYHISGPWVLRGKSYTRFRQLQQPGADFLLPDTLATQLLPHLVSASYWNQRFHQLLHWTYVDDSLIHLYIPDTNTNHIQTSPYVPITFLGYTYQPSEQWPVTFSLLLGGTTYTLPLRAFDQLAEWGAFATTAQVLDRQQHQQSLLDSSLALHTHLTTLDSQYSAVSSQQSAFIDSLLRQLSDDSLQQQQRQTLAEVQRTKQRMNRDQIFLFSIKTARSDYMFGLEFNLYNCFKKTISKIEITVVPYNKHDQIQPDKFDRTVRTVRCMGPIVPGAPAQYLFDELFWNDNDRIKYMRTTSITFYFTDGTTRTYSGYKQILKHTLK